MSSLKLPIIGLLNGPNLNRLGERQTEIYGKVTLSAIEETLRKQALLAGFGLDSFQSNHEGELIDTLWAWHDKGISGILFNPGGLCHTSVSLHDAILGIRTPVIEVHLSAIEAREDFRRESLTARASKECISGFGAVSYEMALAALLKILPVA